MIDLMNQLDTMCQKLDTSVKMLRKSGEDYAKAYTEYRIALARELLILKNEGYAITLAGDIARGKVEIARLKYEEISKEAIYKANLESINALKLEIKLLQSQIDKEWGIEAKN